MLQTSKSTRKISPERRVSPIAPVSAPVSREAFSLREIADGLGISIATVKRAIASGSLRARKIGKRTIVLRADRDAWLESLEDRRLCRG